MIACDYAGEGECANTTIKVSIAPRQREVWQGVGL